MVLQLVPILVISPKEMGQGPKWHRNRTFSISSVRPTKYGMIALGADEYSLP
jgi:hypothetical protein